MSRSNQLALYVFSDGELTPIPTQMAQSQISNNNNNGTLFNLLPALNQVQSSAQESL